MKLLKKLVITLVLIYVITLGLVYVDVYDSRPIVNLFKNFQSDSSLKIVDFSVESKSDERSKPAPNKDRNPYYGDLHVHTKYSFDAYVFGVTASPDDAYKYAKGEGIKHPLGYEMKLREPLDFYSVTDHGFYMGMIQAYADTSTEISQNDFAEPFHNINRLENLTVESAGQRSNIFSSVLGATIIQPYPDWHPKLLMAYLTRNTQLAL